LENAYYRSVQNHLPSVSCLKKLKTKILPVVLHGCETWFHALREGHRLRVSENRVLRKVIGHKREFVMGGWKKLHEEELHNFCAI